jgi:hypothetical protein
MIRSVPDNSLLERYTDGGGGGVYPQKTSGITVSTKNPTWTDLVTGTLFFQFLGQPIWASGHWNMFLSESYDFPSPESFHHCSIFIFHSTAAELEMVFQLKVKLKW